MPISASASCVSGSITNCQVYTSANSNTYTATCSNCQNGYALISGVCTLLPAISVTAPTNVKCNADEAPIMVSSFCKVNAVPYCTTFVSTVGGSCSECMAGYRLDRDVNLSIKTPNTCVPIAAATNCSTWDETNNICSKCSANYILY